MEIGQYINYTPLGGEESYKSEQAHNGSGDQTIERETLNWRVLDIGTGDNELDEGTVKIISDPTTTSVTYKGAEGYNNAVKDLNDMCQTLYSHGTTYARSVNLDDFTTSSFKSNFTQSTTAYGAYYEYNTFPKIYQYEYNESLGQSQQSQWYSETYKNMSFKCSYWSGSIPSDSPLYNSSFYWLSSRCVDAFTNPFGTFAILNLQSANTSLDVRTMYQSSGGGYYGAYGVRAVVTLPASCTYGTERGDEGNLIIINW